MCASNPEKGVPVTSIHRNAEQANLLGRWVNSLCRGSAERERISLHARIEKLDLELSISDGLRLSDQLIQPLFANRAVALVVNVNSVSSARRPSIDEHAKSHGSSSRCRSHDEMKIAGVKAVRDRPVGLVEHSSLFPHRPITRKSPIIEPQPRGGIIEARLVQYRTTGRRKVLGALIAEIVFRRPQAAPIGGSFSTTGIDRNQVMAHAAVSGLFEQLLNNHLRLFVCALAELMMSNMPLCIDEIEGRPITVVESTPYRIVVIDRDRIINPHVLRGSANVIDVFLKCELRRMHADHNQSLILVFLGPRADIGK